MVLVHVGAEHTSIADAAPAFGWRSIARDYFEHDPPSPLELEQAIDGSSKMSSPACTRELLGTAFLSYS